MQRPRSRLLALLALSANLLPLAPPTLAQSSDDGELKTRLIGQPLYLRGFWTTDQLHFNSQGVPQGRPQAGPITLCGIDVTRVERKGKQLVLHGIRVALIQSQTAPGLERRQIVSVTSIDGAMLPSSRKGIHEPEQITITLGADPQGSFDAALDRIFVNGLPALATIVPAYWQCYANSYFKAETIAPDAEATVNHCVITPDDATSRSAPDPALQNDAHTQPPQLLAAPPLQLPLFAMHPAGIAILHLRVAEDGRPVGLQVVRAIGAGLDEFFLQLDAQNRYRPASRDGKPVPFNTNLTYRLAQPNYPSDTTNP